VGPFFTNTETLIKFYGSFPFSLRSQSGGLRRALFPSGQLPRAAFLSFLPPMMSAISLLCAFGLIAARPSFLRFARRCSEFFFLASFLPAPRDDGCSFLSSPLLKT